MFSTDSILKEVNIFGKVVAYILILVSLIVVKSPIFLIFVNIFLLWITKPFSNLVKMNLFNFGVTLFGIFFPQLLWITKIIILIIYTELLKKVTETIELRYVLENTFYRFQKKKVTYRILYLIYFEKYFKNNLKKMLLLKDDYGLKKDRRLISFLLQQSYRKTKENMQDFMQTYQLRFYNDSKKRTYIEKNSWETWDTNYIMVHVVILLLVFFYGR